MHSCHAMLALQRFPTTDMFVGHKLDLNHCVVARSDTCSQKHVKQIKAFIEKHFADVGRRPVRVKVAVVAVVVANASQKSAVKTQQAHVFNNHLSIDGKIVTPLNLSQK